MSDLSSKKADAVRFSSTAIKLYISLQVILTCHEPRFKNQSSFSKIDRSNVLSRTIEITVQNLAVTSGLYLDSSTFSALSCNSDFSLAASLRLKTWLPHKVSEPVYVCVCPFVLSGWVHTLHTHKQRCLSLAQKTDTYTHACCQTNDSQGDKRKNKTSTNFIIPAWSPSQPRNIMCCWSLATFGAFYK